MLLCLFMPECIGKAPPSRTERQRPQSDGGMK